MTTCAFWSTAGLEMTGATDGVALAAGATEAPGEPAGVGLCALSEALATTVAGFLQPTKLKARTRERIANRVSINAVKRFKLERRNYKRFLGFTPLSPVVRALKNRWRWRTDAV